MTAKKNDRYFIPTLGVNHDTPIPSGPGWRDDSGKTSFLSTLSRDIVAKGTTDDGVINAVPTVYGRPLLFYQILKGDRRDEVVDGVSQPSAYGELRDRVVEEWRGLLALIALRELFQGQFKVANGVAWNFSAPPRSIDKSLLLPILKTLVPGSPWNQCDLILVNDDAVNKDVLVGGTSPLSIVFAPATYSCPSSVPWAKLRDPGDPTKGNRLADPTKVLLELRGGRKFLVPLQLWVASVLKQENIWGIPFPDARVTISQLLREWSRNLVAVLDQGAVRDAESDFALAEHGLIARDPYDIPTRAVLPIGSKPPESDLFLKRTVPGKDRPIVLSEDGLQSEALVFRDSQIAVWGKDINAIPEHSDGTGFATKNGARVPHTFITPKKLFFPPYLFKMTGSPSTLNRRYGQYDYTLPLTSSFLEYFTLRDVRRLLKLSTLNDVVEAELTLPVEKGGPIRIKKTYSKEMILPVVNTPIVEIWPEFQHAEWQHYFVYCRHAEVRSGIGVVPIFSGPDGGQLDATLQPTRTIWPARTPALGVELTSDTDTPGAAGLLLVDLDKLRVLDPKEKEWVIGVDFGTSNTQLIYRDGHGAPEKLVINPGSVPLTEAEPGARLHDLKTNFFQPLPITPDFPTMFRNGKGLAAISFFQDHPGEWTSDVIDDLQADIKWTEGTNKEPITKYLKHLAIQIAAEAVRRGVNRAHFRWSYPSAMSESLLKTMDNFWRFALQREITERTPLNADVDVAMTESAAVFHYLVNEVEVTVGRRVIVLGVDIGGGTTDIAAWTGGQLRLQTSLKLAGNDTIAALARGWPEFRERLWKVLIPNTSLHDPVRSSFKRAHTIVVNNLLGLDTERRLFGELFDSARQNEEPWVQARALVYTFMTGIMFHAGLLVASLKDPANEVEIYLAGKGAKLLSWLSLHPMDAQRALEDAFGDGFESGSGRRCATQVILKVRGDATENWYKQEVARGLVSPTVEQYRDGQQGQPAPVGPTILAGEKGYQFTTGQDVEWSQALELRQLIEIVPPKDDGFDDLFITKFLSAVVTKHAEGFGIKKELNRLLKTKIKSSRIEAHLNKLRNDGENAIPQSLFAIELREVMRSYIEQVVPTSKA